MRISDWSSDVCSSDLEEVVRQPRVGDLDRRRFRTGADIAARDFRVQVCRQRFRRPMRIARADREVRQEPVEIIIDVALDLEQIALVHAEILDQRVADIEVRSEEHTSELQSLMSIKYDVS